MATKQRSEIINNTDTVVLKVQFKDQDGYLSDLDTYPNITIVQPSGNVMLGPTSLGVYRIGTGQYAYNFQTGLNESIGVYFDVWNGLLDGASVSGSFNFIIYNTQVPSANTDGYLHLGDQPAFSYSQNALSNINKIIYAVSTRLNSKGKTRVKDEFGNVVYQDCSIFSIEQLAVFASISLTAFNEIPHFTAFSMEDSEIIIQFFEVLVQHAVIYALASKALIERGREFNISDNGVSFQPPGVSEILQTQYTTELNNWFEKVKLIKQNCKPAPLGLGTLSSLGSNRQVMRLRHLRQRQLF